MVLVIRRTADLTSTIRRATTMTINIRVEAAENLFTKNEVINFAQAAAPSTNAVAGASWVVDGSSYEAFLLVFNHVLTLVKSRLPDHELWLLVGSQVWQPDTRVVRYYKLWDGLRRRGLKIPDNKQSIEEVMIESQGKLKFFGAAKLFEFAVEEAARILFEEHCAYVVAWPSGLPVHTLLEHGWSSDARPDLEFISRSADSDALLLKKIGEFDDPERGLLAMGRQPVVNALFS